jgi:hypothetical protein
MRPWRHGGLRVAHLPAIVRTASAEIPASPRRADAKGRSPRWRSPVPTSDRRSADARRPEVEHRVHQREEKRGIGAGADEMVACRDVRRLGAARSTTTTLPPRSRIAFNRFATSAWS